MPSQQKTSHETRREVQYKVRDTSREPGSQTLLQLIPAVLQPQHKQEQQNPNLCPHANKGFIEPKRRETTIAESESSQKIQRDRGETPATGNPRQHSKTNDDQTQFDEHKRHVVRGGDHTRI